MIYPQPKHPYILQLRVIIRHLITERKERRQQMKKIPYTMALLLPTLSPVANIAIFEDGREMKTLYRGKAIKAQGAGLDDREVKHIGVNEVTAKENGVTLEIFLY